RERKENLRRKVFNREWRFLSDVERGYARQLGFTGESGWNNDDEHGWAQTPAWEAMGEEERQAALRLQTCTNCARCEPGQLLGIAKACVENQMLMKAPYQLSIYTALVAGWTSLPLVFHYTTASIFNDYFVTAEPPDVGEADTWLEVGAWSWSWMEPPLGTISFFLLCIQFARDQRMSIGGLSMVEQMQEKQIAMIARQAAFARFDGPALRQYVSCIAMVNDTEELEREHAEILKLLQKR
ncbi:hypothetical protein Ctob_003574, partial [Chrysochromulina tobinii]